MVLEIHPGFGFSNNTRLGLAMSKSVSNPNFDKIAQSTVVLLLLLSWENGHPPYWNYIPVSIWPIDGHGYWHFAL